MSQRLASAPLLTCRDLRVGHGRALLEGVQLSFAPGEAWFVLGPNGCGKTSLLATLVGGLRPLGGEVVFGPALRDRRRLGYVPQEQRFLPPLPCTVGEFVAMALDRRDAAEAGPRIARALESMAIAGLRDADVRTLSVGQRRRLLVARALARAPLLCLLDEPAANLDAVSAHQLARDLERWRGDGMCLVQVTHEVELARRHATHLAIAAAGRVVAGPAPALFASDAFVALLVEQT